MMIHDCQPYSFVEDRGFSEQLEPGYHIPHRTKFSRSIIPSIYSKTKREVESMFTDVLQAKTRCL